MSAYPLPGQVRAVSIGGGTGQPNAIRALRAAGCFVTAIVAMADDGGSTGIIRQEMGMVPPGDIRKCLVAMAADPAGPLARAFEHRFSFADNHSLGNLLLASLAAETGSFGEAIELCGEMLGCHGKVCPSTMENVVLCGRTRDGMEFRGEATLGSGPCALSEVWLSPRAPQATEAAIEAILEADVVVLGPGSLFTSVIPNILVPGIRDALHATNARKVYVCSMADMQGETWGLSAEEYVAALLDHGMEGCLDAVLLHKPLEADASLATRRFRAITQTGPSDMGISDEFFRPVPLSEESLRRLQARVPLVIVRDFSDPAHPTWHDLSKLKCALRGVIETCPSRQR